MSILAISPASVTSINRTIYAELKRRGWGINLVVPKTHPVSNGEPLVAEGAREVDPPTYFFDLKGKNQRTFHFPQMESLMREKSPTIVIIESDPVSYMAVHLGILCQKYGASLFTLSCENLPFDVLPTLKRRGARSLPASLLKKILYLIAKPKIHTVFTISDDGTSIFLKKGFPRVFKIPLGFDSSIFYKNNKVRAELRNTLQLNYPVIAYFGRIVEEKGVDLLIRALTKIKHLNWHFMLDQFSIETNPYHKYINELILLLGIAERVVPIKANHYEIASYMNAADVVVVPSKSTPKWKEQYGRVVPEAMACGKVVIASRCGALPELIGDAGLLFDEGEIDQLVLLLTEFLMKPENYKDKSCRAEERAKSFLSIDRQADIYEEKFRQLNLKPN